MLIYLDSVIVIYAIEGAPPFKARARTRLAALMAAGDQAAVSDLTRLECRVKPLGLSDLNILADFETFFTAPDLVWVPITPAVFERATQIRAHHKFKLGDSLHLAVAAEHGCERFLTNDHRLASFPDLTIDILP